MTRIGLALLCAAIGTGCATSQAQQSTPSPTPALVNPSFDAQGGSLAGWATRGEEFGRADVAKDQVASSPAALLMTAGPKGSTGNDSLMVYQVLDPAPYRGRRVRFSAKIRTEGGGVNMTLFTPEGFGNDFFNNLKSGRFVDRSASFTVPKNASFLSFGIQIFGPSGARAYVDDVQLTAEGQRSSALPPLTLPPLLPPRAGSHAAGRC
jgi:hypothetical protein